MSSSAINPVLYGWFNSNFRSAFLDLLGFGFVEKSFEIAEKTKKKQVPPLNIDKNRSVSGSSKNWRKSPRASPRVGHELARPASFSSSSTGKGAVWTHAQYVVEHVEGSPVVKSFVNLSPARAIPSPMSVEKVQPSIETDCFLTKSHRGSLISYDSIVHKDKKGSFSSYDTCSVSGRKDKKGSSSSNDTSSVSGHKDKKGSSSSYDTCSVSGGKDKKGSSSSYETCSVSGRKDLIASSSSYDTCSAGMPGRKDLKGSCSSFDSLFGRKDRRGSPSSSNRGSPLSRKALTPRKDKKGSETGYESKNGP